MIDNIVTLEAELEWHQWIANLSRTGQFKGVEPLSQSDVAGVRDDDAAIGALQQFRLEYLVEHFRLAYLYREVNGEMKSMVTSLQDAVKKALKEEKPIRIYAIKLLNLLVTSGCYPQLEGTRDDAMKQWKARQESRAMQRDNQSTHSTKSKTTSTRTADSHIPATNTLASSSATKQKPEDTHPAASHVVSLEELEEAMAKELFHEPLEGSRKDATTSSNATDLPGM